MSESLEVYGQTVTNSKQAGDSVIMYKNVRLDGEKQQCRLESMSQTADMYVEALRNSKAGWRQRHKVQKCKLTWRETKAWLETVS